MIDKFYGVRLTDTTGKSYFTEVELKQNFTHKINIQIHEPIDSKFPYSTRIGKPSYWSGSIIGAFENNENGKCENDYVFGDVDFRINFIEWLHNGLTKIMYLSDNFILPVTILSEIKVDTERTINDPFVNTSFDWVQCGERIYSVDNLHCTNCNQIITPMTNYCSNCGIEVSNND